MSLLDQRGVDAVADQWTAARGAVCVLLSEQLVVGRWFGGPGQIGRFRGLKREPRRGPARVVRG